MFNKFFRIKNVEEELINLNKELEVYKIALKEMSFDFGGVMSSPFDSTDYGIVLLEKYLKNARDKARIVHG